MHATAALPDLPDLAPRPGIAATRIGIGLLQGLVLYLLYRAGTDMSWPATMPRLFVPLLMVSVLAPVIAISALGQLTRRQGLAWVGAAAAVVAALAFYDAWRMEGTHLADAKPRGPEPSPQLCVFLAAGFFIAHALVLSGAADRRRIAHYATYFETAWKLGVQLAFSGLFVGVTWLVLQLGAQLFLLIKLDFLSKAIQESSFSIPVTTFAFASAMHLTDVRPAIVRGIRNLLLVLLSWILPVLTLLVAGFLASLLFTGLEPLWATRRAAAVLLGAAAAFVVLINAAWQEGGLNDGQAGAAPVARIIALSARIAALLLVPVTLLAMYALALRVREHGWTDDRVIAAACMLVAACYAGGYAAAALRKGWLASIAGVNIAAAFVVLGVLALLFSPVADPDRLSVNDQLARLKSGQVTAARFDVGYLHFQGARFGREALARLEADSGIPDAALLRTRIAAVRKMRYPYQENPLQDPPVLAENLQAWPKGTRLPESFLRMDWTQVDGRPACLRQRGVRCDAFLLDLGGGPELEVILVGDTHGSTVLHDAGNGQWRLLGWLPASVAGCGRLKQALRDGQVRAAPSAWSDIEIGGQRLGLRESQDLQLDCGPPVAPVPRPMPVQPDATP